MASLSRADRGGGAHPADPSPAGPDQAMKVYVAGPYSQGDTVANVRAAIDAADKLVAAGHTPYIPHLTMFWHLITPRPYRWWLDYDAEWLACCDAVLRLPGESVGADEEVKLATLQGMPVFHAVEELP